MTEIQPYTVVREFEGVELRDYPEHVLVEVDAAGDFFTAGNLGFRPLLRYISGDNAARASIAMTAPVIQQPTSQQKHVVSFVLPANLTPADVPAPADGRVRTRVVPAGRVAAMRFSGGSNEQRYEDRASDLLAALRRAGIAPTGDVYFARYDPPWKPGFLKRNEALVAVAPGA
jgi:hypothetical protein